MDAQLQNFRDQLANTNTKIDALRAYKEKTSSKLIKDRIKERIDQLQVDKAMWQRNIGSIETRLANESNVARKAKKDKYKAKNIELGECCADENCNEDSPCNYCLAEILDKEQATADEIRLILNV